MASAGPMSTDRIRAAAWGERTVRPKRAPSAHRSEPKAKRPRTLGTPSGRGTLVPMRGGAPVVTVVDGVGHRAEPRSRAATRTASMIRP